MDIELLNSLETMQYSLNDIVNAIKNIDISDNDIDSNKEIKEYLNSINNYNKSIDTKINGYLDNINESQIIDYTEILSEIKTILNNISSNNLTEDIKVDLQNKLDSLELNFNTDKLNSVLETISIPELDLNINIDNIKTQLSNLIENNSGIDLNIENIKSQLEELKNYTVNITPVLDTENIENANIDLKPNIDIELLKSNIESLSEYMKIDIDTSVLDILNKEYDINAKLVLTNDIETLISDINDIEIKVTPVILDNFTEDNNITANLFYKSNIDDIIKEIDNLDKELKFSIETYNNKLEDVSEYVMPNYNNENIINESTINDDNVNNYENVENYNYNIVEKETEYIKEIDNNIEYIQYIKENNILLNNVIKLLSEQKPIISEKSIIKEKESSNKIMDITNNNTNINNKATDNTVILNNILKSINQLVKQNNRFSFDTNIDF